MPILFLTGYEKETIEEFLSKIIKAKIDLIVDVREIPLSRKNGFSKQHLQKLLESNGVSYLHYPKLGSPSVIRKELYKNGDYVKFFSEYRKYANENAHEIQSVLDSIEKWKHPAIMCYEKFCELCHRSIIASELLKLNNNLRVIPI
ncbi:DUF488 domain-containing protein [Candidatus Curtissbacteria bacterium]|nr:DUF488 domain-containing protein [Candidatus Curtissbacteria bacterium]